MDKVGPSRDPTAKHTSPTFDRGLEERLAEALRQVASLKLELARVRAAYAAVLAAHQAGAAASDPARPAPPAEKDQDRHDDFDWETWARVTKARIRGEDVEATAA